MREFCKISTWLMFAGGLWLGNAGFASAEDASMSTNSSPMVLTNLAQVRTASELDVDTGYNVRLEGIVCAASSLKNVLVLQDDSGTEALQLDSDCRSVSPGQRVVLSWANCRLARSWNQIELSSRPLVDNDRLHRMAEKSGSIELSAGPVPLRLTWFNLSGDYGLEVYVAGPGMPRQRIPDTMLFRSAGSGGPVNIGNQLVNGLAYQGYEGCWTFLPNFRQLVPVTTGTASKIDLNVETSVTNVALQFSGYLMIPRAGSYTFWTKSDDGSQLFVNEALPKMQVIDAPGVPLPHSVEIGQALSAGEQGQWGEVTGTITFASEQQGVLVLELNSGEEQMLVRVADGAGWLVPVLLNSKVRATGVCKGIYSLGGRQKYGLLLVADSHGIKLDSPAPEPWTDHRVISISNLCQSNFESNRQTMVQISGTVEASGPGQMWVHDATGKMLVELLQPAPAGITVDVLGSLRHSAGTAFLQDGFWRQTAENTGVNKLALAVLTTAAQVQRLKPDEADRHYPVQIRAVVICDEPSLYDGLFVQDATRGIFVRQISPTSGNRPKVGEYWEIEGVTMPGDFAPLIEASRMTRLGQTSLPEPARPTWDQLINGSMDAQYVEIQGIVTDVKWQALTLFMHDGKMKVSFNEQDEREFNRLADSLISIRGTLRACWNDKTHQVEVGHVNIGNPLISIVRPASEDIFATPKKSVADLLLYDMQAGALQRVQVTGQIVGFSAGEYYLMDGTNGLHFIPGNPVELRVGELVRVVGFPELGGAAPMLREAAVRQTGRLPLPVAMEINDPEAIQAQDDATRVRLNAVLISIRNESSEQVLQLQTGLRLFQARLNCKNGQLPHLTPGSQLELTGVLVSLEKNQVANQILKSFELLINSPADIRLLSRPPWWNLKRLLVALGLLTGVLAGATLWIQQLHRKVEERTTQLQYEITERERIERHAAVEGERSRIARDLHDDLGSSLTEINLLGTMGLEGDPAAGNDCLSQIVNKARDSVNALDIIVWAVNPEENTLQSLADYLASFATDFVGNSGIACRIRMPVEFPPLILDGRTRHDLFLATREALNNAIRHAHAGEIEIGIALTDRLLRIHILDNGCGFDPNARRIGNGLANLTARLAGLQGSCKIQSCPGAGTTVTLELWLAKDQVAT